MARLATARPVAPHCPLERARARLRAVLNHPAFTAERQRHAEQLLAATTDVQQLTRWARLALVESERWEDETLAREEAQAGRLAHPPYPY